MDGQKKPGVWYLIFGYPFILITANLYLKDGSAKIFGLLSLYKFSLLGVDLYISEILTSVLAALFSSIFIYYFNPARVIKNSIVSASIFYLIVFGLLGFYVKSLSDASLPIFLFVYMILGAFVVIGITGIGGIIVKKVVTTFPEFGSFLEFFFKPRGWVFLTAPFLIAWTVDLLYYGVIFLQTIKWQILGFFFFVFHPALWGAIFLLFFYESIWTFCNLGLLFFICAPFLIHDYCGKVQDLRKKILVSLGIMIGSYLAAMVAIFIVMINTANLSGVIAEKGINIWPVLLDRWNVSNYYGEKYKYHAQKGENEKAQKTKEKLLREGFKVARYGRLTHNDKLANNTIKNIAEVLPEDPELDLKLARYHMDAYYDGIEKMSSAFEISENYLNKVLKRNKADEYSVAAHLELAEIAEMRGDMEQSENHFKLADDILNSEKKLS